MVGRQRLSLSWGTACNEWVATCLRWWTYLGPYRPALALTGLLLVATSRSPSRSMLKSKHCLVGFQFAEGGKRISGRRR